MNAKRKDIEAESHDEGSTAEGSRRKRRLTPEELEARDQLYLRLLAEAKANPSVVFPPWAAARNITICESTLATWRREGIRAFKSGEADNEFGQGPRYVRLSGTKVGYPYYELDAYKARRTFAHTSAEPNAPKRPGNRRAEA